MDYKSNIALILLVCVGMLKGQTHGGVQNGFSFPTIPGYEDDDKLHLPSLPTCLTMDIPKPYVEWQENIKGSSVSVEWTYGNETCNSMNSCFGLNWEEDLDLEPQLAPLDVQQWVEVRFFASKNPDVNLSIQPYWVDEEGFRNCNTTGGVAVIPEATHDEFVVDQKFLKPGMNYFVAATNDNIFKCEFGLRLNVTVKPPKCKGPGQPAFCWTKGRCVTRALQPVYECACCQGFSGPYCEDLDACQSHPCENHGICVDVLGDYTGTKFHCQCPTGYYGPTCHNRATNLCMTEICENNGTCEGDANQYKCHCLPGFTGMHCEVNINDCDPNPCKNGVCVDKVNGYQCFCKPGWSGNSCDQEYNECQSNPCKNEGFCIDNENGYVCHCGRGFSGKDCSMKVDLCNPQPCVNATECVDYGNIVSCTCNPGFTGVHCEININECESNPCQNNGRCYDMTAGYKCYCNPGHAGPKCEKTIIPHLISSQQSQYTSSSHHHSHLHNLYIVAGTLAGALLIALLVLAGCYCRIYGSAHLRSFNQYRYKQQINDGQKERVEQSSVNRSRPTADAIIEATSHDYQDNTMNTPLVNSLKAKKV